jgi:hypothetical protein
VIATPISAQTPAPTAAPDSNTARVLSAFYGLDDKLPLGINRWCIGGGGDDGMPVVFSHPIDPTTLGVEDFEVITKSGKVSKPMCAILEPAIDPGELRTVLLVGRFGDDKTDPPMTVKVVSDLLAGTGDPNLPRLTSGLILNFKGQVVAVTPLEAGPFLVDAEIPEKAQWKLGVTTGSGQTGTGCPKDKTLNVVRVTWSGGVSKKGGGHVDDVERKQYTVMVKSADGKTQSVVPFALGDLEDGDNIHLLCLDVAGDPLRVTFAAGFLKDPNDDAYNPAADVPVRATN